MFFGTLIEELISPIPSFVVLIPAGVAAQVQGVAVWYLLVLAVLSGLGRALGAAILYWVGDKFEDILLAKNRKLFGYRHEDVEKLGARFSGKPRDWLVIFAINAIPVIPIALLPLACGFLRVRFRMVITATFFGTIINALVYMGIGYAGLAAATALQSIETAGQIIMTLLVAALLVWLLLHYRKRRRAKGRPSA